MTVRVPHGRCMRVASAWFDYLWHAGGAPVWFSCLLHAVLGRNSLSMTVVASASPPHISPVLSPFPHRRHPCRLRAPPAQRVPPSRRAAHALWGRRPPPRPIRRGAAGTAPHAARKTPPSARPAPASPSGGAGSRVPRGGGGGASLPAGLRALVAENRRAPSLPQSAGGWRLWLPVGGARCCGRPPTS